MCHNFQYFGQRIQIIWKKLSLSSFSYAWNWYRSGSAWPGCRSRSGKMMRIGPDLDPDPQHYSSLCIFCQVYIVFFLPRKKLLDTIISYTGPKIVLTRICVAVSGLVIHCIPEHWQHPIQVRGSCRPPKSETFLQTIFKTFVWSFLKKSQLLVSLGSR